MLRFHIVSLFPSFFDSALSTGLMERALEKGILSVDVTDPREFTQDRHRHVDDRPYGGGPGMVLQPDPIVRALRSLPRPGRMLCMSPSGRAASQEFMRELAREEDITILCGRYEGFDGRLFDLFPLEETSVGDIVLNGGEAAALAVIEAVSRLVPGFMGKEESGDEESFSESLLEYPQYTRPPVYEGLGVPDVLLGGNHAQIASWHRKCSLERTLERRPDLLERARLGREDAEHLAAYVAQSGRHSCSGNIHLCLVDEPVRHFGKENSGKGSPGKSRFVHGELGVEDILSLQEGFALGTGFVVGGTFAGEEGEQKSTHFLRVQSLEEVAGEVSRLHGQSPLIYTVSTWPKKEATQSFADMRALAQRAPVVLVVGRHGLPGKKTMRECDGALRPARFLSKGILEGRVYLSLVLDRILGDFF